MTDESIIHVKKIKEFIAANPLLVNYLHNTESIEIAEKIIQQGFRFEGYIDFTTDMVSGLEDIEIQYFLQTRGRYGNYTIIMQISDELINYYSDKLKGVPNHFSEVLAKEAEDTEEEPIYTLPEQFVKGYYNQQRKQLVKNPVFDPFAKLPFFEENLKKILAKK